MMQMAEKVVGKGDILEWLEGLHPDHIVQNCRFSVRACSCVVSNYFKDVYGWKPFEDCDLGPVVGFDGVTSPCGNTVYLDESIRNAIKYGFDKHDTLSAGKAIRILGKF